MVIPVPGSAGPWNPDRQTPRDRPSASFCVPRSRSFHLDRKHLGIQIRAGTRVRLRLGTPELARIDCSNRSRRTRGVPASRLT